MDVTIDEILVRACEAELGERCPDYEPECCVCQAWMEFDKLYAPRA